MTRQEFKNVMLATANSRIDWINFSSALYFSIFTNMIKDGGLIKFTFYTLATWCSKSLARNFAIGFYENLNDDDIDSIFNEYFK